MTTDFLKDIPDPEELSTEAALQWIEESLARLRNYDQSILSRDDVQPFELKEVPEHAFGAEASPHWRKFFLAILLADWATYERKIDQVDFARLKFIMSSSYQYFRLWLCKRPDGVWCPVGYTAWYPIAESVYRDQITNLKEMNDRGVFLPLRKIPFQDIRCVYVLNISVIAPLRNTVFSQRMIRAFRRDAKRIGNAGIVAVTVDVAGQKLSKLTGLEEVGKMLVGGETETVFARRPGSQRPSTSV